MRVLDRQIAAVCNFGTGEILCFTVTAFKKATFFPLKRLVTHYFALEHSLLYFLTLFFLSFNRNYYFYYYPSFKFIRSRVIPA